MLVNCIVNLSIATPCRRITNNLFLGRSALWWSEVVSWNFSAQYSLPERPLSGNPLWVRAKFWGIDE